jgi:hypothetical protein
VRTYIVTECNNVSVSIDTDIDISVADLEAVDELSDINMGNLCSLIGVGLEIERIVSRRPNGDQPINGALTSSRT